MNKESYKGKTAEIQRLENKIKGLNDDARADFLNRARALENIVEGRNLPEGSVKTDSAFWITWGLKVFFIMFEVFPVFIKLMMEKNEYHAYMDARTMLAKQKINKFTNDRLDWIRNAKGGDLEAMVAEMSDSLERLAEDPYYLRRPPSIYQALRKQLGFA